MTLVKPVLPFLMNRLKRELIPRVKKTLIEEILSMARLAGVSYSNWDWDPTDKEVHAAINSLKKKSTKYTKKPQKVS